MEVVFIDNSKSFLTCLCSQSEMIDGEGVSFQFFSDTLAGKEYVLTNTDKIKILVIDYRLDEDSGDFETGLEFCKKLNDIYKILVTNKDISENSLEDFFAKGYINEFYNKTGDKIPKKIFDTILEVLREQKNSVT